MKICIYGAGSIGGLLGARLAHKGNHEVTLIARGAHLEAIRRSGLKLITDEETIVARPAATDDPKQAGPQDVVIVAVKAPAVAGIAEAMQPLLGPDTAVLTAMNGVPWWYFHGLDGPWRDRRIRSLDPNGRLERLIETRRVIGCVVYPAAEIAEPGVIRHGYGNRFMLGEPDGSRSERIGALSAALNDADFKAPVRPKIRDDIWVKLWGNLSFNPVSILTHGTLVQIARDPGTNAVIRRMMEESQRVAEALGVSFGVDIETRIGWAADVGEHKSSMLQDLENGKAMEIDALLTAVVEMGDMVGIETPLLDTILALAIQRGRVAGCYSA
ncbi:MAG: 2-dehydropantoate 2-reductase [Dongiaceae bacterium]